MPAAGRNDPYKNFNFLVEIAESLNAHEGIHRLIVVHQAAQGVVINVNQ